RPRARGGGGRGRRRGRGGRPPPRPPRPVTRLQPQPPSRRSGQPRGGAGRWRWREIRRQDDMRLTAWRLLAIASLLADTLPAATRPHYGGTLRIQMRARVAALNASSEDNFATLEFDRLVTLNKAGQPRPALAISWRHDADLKRWEFQLRPGVKFHDGSPLTAPVAAAALESLGAVAQSDSIVIRSAQPASKLLLNLAGAAIFKRVPDGSVVGTGPFRVTAWEPGRRAVFAANPDYWAGRPYL